MSKRLVKAMSDIDGDAVLEEIRALKEQGLPPQEIIKSLYQGIGIVVKRFEEKEYFISELIMSSEVFNEASQLLGSISEAKASKNRIFVLGTIYDDVHEIGKNIVTAVMRSNGFKVIDLGVDVPTAKFIEAIKKYKPKVVGISCFLSTCFSNIKECIQEIEHEGLRNDVKVLIGGGVVDETVGKDVKADVVAKNAQQTLEYCKQFVNM